MFKGRHKCRCLGRDADLDILFYKCYNIHIINKEREKKMYYVLKQASRAIGVSRRMIELLRVNNFEVELIKPYGNVDAWKIKLKKISQWRRLIDVLNCRIIVDEEYAITIDDTYLE